MAPATTIAGQEGVCVTAFGGLLREFHIAASLTQEALAERCRLVAKSLVSLTPPSASAGDEPQTASPPDWRITAALALRLARGFR